MALRAMIAREIPDIVVSTTEALVKYGVFMVSIAVAYATPSKLRIFARGESAFWTSLNLPVRIGRVEDDETSS